jgi:hypothetical protein
MLLLSLVAGLMLTNVGCPPPPPPAEAVLAGTWTLTTQASTNPDLTQVLLNFDDNGELVSVTSIFLNAQATRTLTSTSTTVDGSNVAVSSTTAGFTLNFTGTLNAAGDVITGNASWALTIGNTTITAQAGPATLTKGAAPVGNAANGLVIWTANCIVCHNGTVAPAAADVDDAQIANFRTIHPQLTNITDQQLLDIEAYLATQP